jgi:hypothetical protein
MDSLTENQGFTKKRSLNSKPFKLYGRLHADICFQNRFIINNIDMNVKLIRSSNNFCLMGDNKFNYEAHIDEAILYVRKVKVSASVMLAHAMALEKSTIKYPITRVETVVHSISSGATIQTFDNISSGVLPKRVVFALVDSDAANGNYVKNCFIFKHYNLSLVSLTVDNQDVPQSPLVLNFSENNFIRAYYGMFGGLDKGGLDWGNNITKEDFLNGYSIFVFDLSPDKCNDEHFNLIRKGNLRLKLTFKDATPHVINCYVYMEYDNMLEITKNINVIFDYTVQKFKHFRYL